MKRLLIVLCIGLGLTTLVLAQQLTSTTLTGNEVVNGAIGGPGGSSIFIPVSQLRDANGTTTTALTTGTLALTTATATLVSTATVSGALALNTPTTPWDGEIFVYSNGSGGANTATVTLTASGTQTVNGGAVATLGNNLSAEWRYSQGTTTWYRIR